MYEVTSMVKSGTDLGEWKLQKGDYLEKRLLLNNHMRHDHSDDDLNSTGLERATRFS
jgi:hypothetical protein